MMETEVSLIARRVMRVEASMLSWSKLKLQTLMSVLHSLVGEGCLNI